MTLGYGKTLTRVWAWSFSHSPSCSQSSAPFITVCSRKGLPLLPRGRRPKHRAEQCRKYALMKGNSHTDYRRGYIHLWMGRVLIVLGVITGGLGIRLTSFSPFRTDSQTRISGIVYGVVAGIMMALYIVIVVLFEIRRKRAARSAPQALPTKTALPSYEESQSSASSLASRQNTGAQGATTANAGVRYS